MVGIPTSINIVLVVVFAGLGLLEARRLKARHPDLVLEGALQDDVDPQKFTAPAMFFVDHPATGRESHAVVYVGSQKGKVEIWDPLSGKRFLTGSELGAEWHGKGIECVAPATLQGGARLPMTNGRVDLV